MVTRKIGYKDEKGRIMEVDIGAEGKNITEDTTHRFVTDAEKENWNKIQNAVSVSLKYSGWTSTAPYTQTVNVPGVTAEDAPVIGILIADGTTAASVKLQNKAWACVDRAVTGAGTVTFYCYNKKPGNDFTVNVKGV